MPVTFGTVQLVPAASPQLAAATPEPPTAGATASLDPRDLGPTLRKLHARAERVRAH